MYTTNGLNDYVINKSVFKFKFLANGIDLLEYEKEKGKKFLDITIV